MSRLPGPRTPRAAISLARRLNTDPYTTLPEMRATYGPVIELGRGRFKYIHLLSPEANEYILATDPSNFTWKEAFQPLVAVDGETALVVSDGDEHKRRRQIVQPAFHVRRIAGYLAVMVEEANHVIDRWRPGEVVDAYAEMRLAIRRVVLRCLFGDELRGRDQEMAEHLEVVLAYVNRPPLRRLDWNLPGFPYRKAMAARRKVDAIVFGEIERRRVAGDESDDVLGWLITAQDDATGLTDQEVRDQVISLVAAGYDTTASAMGWAVAELAADEVHAGAIRAELASAGACDGLEIHHLAGLSYTNAFVSEVLRLHPPAIMSGRKVIADFDIHGHTIPAGAMILFSPHVTHHLAEQFPDPDAFEPGRWIDGHPARHESHPYAFIPFGGGPRRCLGFAFATQELVALTAVLASRVDVSPATSVALRPAGIMSSAPSAGVPVRAVPAGFDVPGDRYDRVGDPRIPPEDPAEDTGGISR